MSTLSDYNKEIKDINELINCFILHGQLTYGMKSNLNKDKLCKMLMKSNKNIEEILTWKDDKTRIDIQWDYIADKQSLYSRPFPLPSSMRFRKLSTTGFYKRFERRYIKKQRNLLYIGCGNDFETTECEWAQHFDRIYCCDNESQGLKVDPTLFSETHEHVFIGDYKDCIDDWPITDILLRGYCPSMKECKRLDKKYKIWIACDTVNRTGVRPVVVHFRNPFNDRCDCHCDCVCDCDSESDSDSDSDSDSE